MKIKLSRIIITFMLTSSAVWAEEGAVAAGEVSANEMAKELSNPNTALASMTLKTQFTGYTGDLPGAEDQFGSAVLFQPVLPFPRKDGSQVFFRPGIPIMIDKPVWTGTEFEDQSGLGDIAFDVAYGFPTTPSGIISAIGIFSSLPTATAEGLGSKQWTLGPEFLLGKVNKKYVALIFPSHQWNVAGWGEESVNVSTLQAGGTLLPGGGWNVGSMPIMSYNWNARQWTLPLNLQVGKTLMLGGSPWKFSTEINYYIEQPDAFGPEWMIGINMTPVVKNYAASMLNDMLR